MRILRTALSKKPETLIQKEIQALREENQLTPDLVFRDPYFLDFLGLKNTYSELPRSEWTDFVAILGREMLGYYIQYPGEETFLGQIMPPASEEAIKSPYYVRLPVSEDAQLEPHISFRHEGGLKLPFWHLHNYFSRL